MSFFPDWRTFAAWLDGLGLFHMDLGLERMRGALRALNLEKLPFQAVQVLGTNGKGSTCAFLAALAKEAGIRTGLYTSPHFVSPKERILVDERQLNDNLWLECANEIFATYPGGANLTYFELLTILALCLFRRQKVEFAILEAGLGGKNDATTAIGVDARCFTPIAMDHAAIIGPTLADIALDKASAIVDSAPVFSARQYPMAKKILVQRAATLGAPLTFTAPSAGARFGMGGTGQNGNAGLALGVWTYLHKDRGDPACLARAFIPGRFQIINSREFSKQLVLDGAHNPHGMRWLTDLISKKAENSPCAVIYSCLADKDWQAAFAMLLGKLPAVPVYIVSLDNPRACNADKVAAFGNRFRPGSCEVCSDMASALKKAQTKGNKSGSILLTGSLYLLAEFFALYPQFLERKD